jgi:hypothetical protein
MPVISRPAMDLNGQKLDLRRKLFVSDQFDLLVNPFIFIFPISFTKNAYVELGQALSTGGQAAGFFLRAFDNVVCLEQHGQQATLCTDYFPLNSGLRRCMNAVKPSITSSLARHLAICSRRSL